MPTPFGMILFWVVFPEGLVEGELQLFRGGYRGGHDCGGAQPVPEILLPGLQGGVGVVELLGRDGQLFLVVQQEEQAFQAGLGGGFEFELGVGQVGAVADRGAVAQADQADVDVGLADPDRAEIGGLVVAGGEVGHVSDGFARPGDGRLRGGHERARRRVIPQLGGVA